ncbi:hypothetical protein ACX1C1_00310 [Paenibacillus sp. strain BS8-2]
MRASFLSMSKLLMMFLVSLMILSLSSNPRAAANPVAKDVNLLVVYDSLAIGTPNSGNVEALLRLLSAMGVHAELLRLSDQAVPPLRDYDAVIAIRNHTELEGGYAKLHEELSNYKGHYLHVGAGMDEQRAASLQLIQGISELGEARLSVGPLRLADFVRAPERLPYISSALGTSYGRVVWTELSREAPFGVRLGTTAYVPVFRKGAPSCIALGYLIRDWLGLSRQGHAYLVYKEIYPFSDLGLLHDLSGELYRLGLPFIYSVRPVYRNTDFPAMKRYTEMLRGAQSRNGTIFANASVLSPAAGIETSTLKEKTEVFLNTLAENDIVPLGTGADAAYWWREEMGYVEDGMEPFDSALLFAPPDPSLLVGTEGIPTRVFASSMLDTAWHEIEPYWQRGDVETLPVDLAITLDFYSSQTEMEESLLRLRDSRIPFADYKYGEHETRTTRHIMGSRDGILYLDGEQVGLSQTIEEVSDEFDYGQDGPKSFERLFTIQNYIYLTIIVFALVVFGAILLVGYRLYRRKYMKGGGD